MVLSRIQETLFTIWVISSYEKFYYWKHLSNAVFHALHYSKVTATHSWFKVCCTVLCRVSLPRKYGILKIKGLIFRNVSACMSSS